MLLYRHRSAMVSPNQRARPEKRNASCRDARGHRKLDLQQRLEAFDWSLIYSSGKLTSDSLKRMYDENYPLVKIKTSSRDSPYMTPLLKHLCKNGRNTSTKETNMTYKNALPIERTKYNSFVKRTEKTRLDHRNGGTL